MEGKIELSVAQARALKKLSRQNQSILELGEQKKTLDILVKKGFAINGNGLFSADYQLKPKKNKFSVLCADCGEKEAETGESLCFICAGRVSKNLSHPEPKTGK